MELAIIGGGAAGMMAALTAAEWMEGTITLLERQNRLGRKLLATGNGRCNLSNLTCAPSHYHGGHPDFVRPALDAFGVTDTLAFFRQRGLLTIAEPDGKCYPYSDQANSVLDTLRLALDAAGVVVRTDWPVEAIRPGKSGGFTLTGSAGSLWADRVILTAGGAAAPKLGGTKSGYQLAKTLGHKCTRLHPSLVQLNTDPTWPKSLKGVRADAVVKLLMDRSWQQRKRDRCSSPTTASAGR
ncbi:MAG: aminoacetone oxidase family FAD-binding enzyme [Oscillospiraceae bacterium]